MLPLLLPTTPLQVTDGTPLTITSPLLQPPPHQEEGGFAPRSALPPSYASEHATSMRQPSAKVATDIVSGSVPSLLPSPPHVSPCAPPPHSPDSLSLSLSLAAQVRHLTTKCQHGNIVTVNSEDLTFLSGTFSLNPVRVAVPLVSCLLARHMSVGVADPSRDPHVFSRPLSPLFPPPSQTPSTC